MEKVLRLGLMVQNIVGNIMMERSKEKVNLNSQMDQFTMVNLK